MKRSLTNLLGVGMGVFTRTLFDKDDPLGVEEADCFDPSRAPELYGPTDVTAQVANQRLAVGLNGDGTVTVFRYPTPSYYDQVKYRTSSRDRELFGAAPNEGMFLGVVIEGDGGPVFEPFRTWETSQEYDHGGTDTLVTTHTSERRELEAVVTDVVPPDVDGLVRDVEVRRSPGAAAEDVSLVAFENFNLVCSKKKKTPVRDWCLEKLNTDTAQYLSEPDAITHLKRGVDASTGIRSSIATAVGFEGRSTQRQVGGDAHEPSARDTSQPIVPTDALEDASDGRLEGNTRFDGQTTGALLTPLSFSGGVATERVLLTAARSLASGSSRSGARARAIAELGRLRGDEGATGDLRRRKEAWVRDHLADAPMPDTDDEAVLAVCERALVCLVTTFEPGNGAIVASIATQSPYGEDWPRDSAFFNYVLDLVGKPEWVRRRNEWFADLQVKRLLFDNPIVPPGNWAMNYYADGVPGGPIPWEIDETGFVLWAFWDHYKATGDRDYLESVYDAVRRSADFLAWWRDPRNGLHIPVYEDDNVELRQTIVGAGPVWLGLDSAVKAAEALGHEADAARWRRRRETLAGGIERALFDTEGGFYGKRDRPGFPEQLWPIAFHHYDHPRMRSHAERAWESASRSLAEPEAGELEFGQYEPKFWLGLAKAWKGDEELMDRVREGIRWSAEQHAEPGTHVMGEAWLNVDGEIVSAVSQPHIWEMCLLYLAALEAFPPAGLEGEPRSPVGGWLEVLRDDHLTRRIRA
jgi:hypothetical protein